MVTLIIGLIGAFIILFAFVMNQTGKWKADYLIYDLFNSVGGIILIIYTILIKSYPFLLLNSVWTIVSIWEVYSDIKKPKKKKKAHMHHKRK